MRTRPVARASASSISTRAKPVEKVEWFPEVEQGSDEWFELRRGMCTASNFGAMLAGGEGISRAGLMHRLAAEILSGKPIETYRSPEMERGNAMEHAAREHYVFTHDLEPDQWQLMGFVKRTISDPLFGERVIGCSPDLLVGENKVVQIKTKRPDLIVELVSSGRPFPTEHKAQCQGEMWVTGGKVCDLLIFYEGMPIAPVYKLERDDSYIANVLAPGVERFQHELAELLKSLRKRWSLR